MQTRSDPSQLIQSILTHLLGSDTAANLQVALVSRAGANGGVDGGRRRAEGVDPRYSSRPHLATPVLGYSWSQYVNSLQPTALTSILMRVRATHARWKVIDAGFTTYTSHEGRASAPRYSDALVDGTVESAALPGPCPPRTRATDETVQRHGPPSQSAEAHPATTRTRNATATWDHPHGPARVDARPCRASRCTGGPAHGARRLRRAPGAGG